MVSSSWWVKGKISFVWEEDGWEGGGQTLAEEGGGRGRGKVKVAVKLTYTRERGVLISGGRENSEEIGPGVEIVSEGFASRSRVGSPCQF